MLFIDRLKIKHFFLLNNQAKILWNRYVHFYQDYDHFKSLWIKKNELVYIHIWSNIYLCKFINLKKCLIIHSNHFQKQHDRCISIGISMCWPSKMDKIIHDISSLSIDHFIPIFTRHSYTSKINIHRYQRWINIVEYALHQSKSNTIINLCSPISLKSIDAASYTHIFIFVSPSHVTFLQEQKIMYNKLNLDYLNFMHKRISVNDKILILVGPEGGFSTDELLYLSTLKNQYFLIYKDTILTVNRSSLIFISILKLIL